MNTRTRWRIAVGALAMSTVNVASAQTGGADARSTYPVRPIRLLIPLPPGGGADFLGRALAQQLSDQFGKSVIPDNRGGASGAIAGELAARAAPDGYTLFLAYAASHGINPALSKLPYDPLKDFTAITYMAQSQNMISAHPSFAVGSIKELIAVARTKPGKIAYSSAGMGSATHLSTVLLEQMTGTTFTHVPHKGSGPALIDLLGGHVQFSFASLPAVLPHTRAGKLRAIAVSGLKRSPIVPDLPTVAESDPSRLSTFETNQWYVLLGPARLPGTLVSRLNDETNKALTTSEVRARLEQQGFEIETSTPQAAHEFVKRELVKWAKVVAAAGLKSGDGR